MPRGLQRAHDNVLYTIAIIHSHSRASSTVVLEDTVFLLLVDTRAATERAERAVPMADLRIIMVAICVEICGVVLKMTGMGLAAG